MILTIFCPQSKAEQGRTLSGIFGLGAADYTHSFPSFNWTDGSEPYSVHECPVSDSVANAVRAAQQGGLLLRNHTPSWHVGDVTSAQSAIESANFVLELDLENPPNITLGQMIIALDVFADQLAPICGLRYKEESIG